MREVQGIAAAANVFIGMIEAPLLIRPYVPGMTQSEVMTLMVGGCATIAGSVLAVYIGLMGGGAETTASTSTSTATESTILGSPPS